MTINESWNIKPVNINIMNVFAQGEFELSYCTVRLFHLAPGDSDSNQVKWYSTLIIPAAFHVSFKLTSSDDDEETVRAIFGQNAENSCKKLRDYLSLSLCIWGSVAPTGEQTQTEHFYWITLFFNFLLGVKSGWLLPPALPPRPSISQVRLSLPVIWTPPEIKWRTKNSR